MLYVVLWGRLLTVGLGCLWMAAVNSVDFYFSFFVCLHVLFVGWVCSDVCYLMYVLFVRGCLLACGVCYFMLALYIACGFRYGCWAGCFGRMLGLGCAEFLVGWLMLWRRAASMVWCLVDLVGSYVFPCLILV